MGGATIQPNENTAPASRPSFYAIIPATVRYDKAVPPAAKLLYGEISALCNAKGYCWAGNAYFAKLYGASERNVIRWINALRDAGYVKIIHDYKNNTRKIRLADVEKPNGEQRTPEEEPDRRGDKIVIPPGQKCQEGVTKLSEGSDKNVTHNITNNNKDTTTAAAVEETEKSTGKPQEGKKTAAAVTPESLKKIMLKADPGLILDAAFYPKAAAFMAQNGLTLDYPPWLYSLCELKNPKSLDGLFFRLFFEGNIIEKFRAANKPTAPPAPSVIACQVCGREYPKGAQCPECGYAGEASQDQERLTFLRKFHLLSQDKKAAYRKREDAIYEENGILKAAHHILKLKEEFGLA